MRLDAASWPCVLAALPEAAEPPVAGQHGLAVVLLNQDDFAAKSGPAWLWWPDRRRAASSCAFSGKFAADWGMVLVMSEAALDSLCTLGSTCLAGLVRRLQVKPFLLQEMHFLEAGGLADFIDSLELATPKH